MKYEICRKKIQNTIIIIQHIFHRNSNTNLINTQTQFHQFSKVKTTQKILQHRTAFPIKLS